MNAVPADGAGAPWLGRALILLFALIAPIAWLMPLGFAPLAVAGGLLGLRHLRIGRSERGAAFAIAAMVCWAAISMAWSPYKPTEFGKLTAVKLAAEAVFYWSMFRLADAPTPRAIRRALAALTWTLAAYGVVLVVEAATGAFLLRTIRDLIGDPIRPDLAIRNAAQGAFVLAILAPVGMLAGWRLGAGPWPGLLMVAGVLAATFALAADAPTTALVLGGLLGGAAYVWPKAAPRVMAGAAMVYFLSAPWLVVAARKMGLYQAVESRVELSWAMRLRYWSNAANWIADHPLRGWGIDASREFAPGINLHPHNAALQLWLELGLVGPLAAGVLFAAIFAAQARDRRDPAAAAAVAVASAYLIIGAVSFGVWQEWWLGAGAVAAAACLAFQRLPGRASAPKPA